VSARRTPAVVIGAGPAGLATGTCLTRHGVDHVVLERGEVAHSWRTERWDSLRLLTPNWMSRLPGSGDPGDDRDGVSNASVGQARPRGRADGARCIRDCQDRQLRRQAG
jgi:cation diffusion facilitator CzcD-associated flavoprotein CzcO